MDKMTRKQARQFLNQIYKNGVDLEEGETKRDWIDAMMDSYEEDGILID